MAIIPLAQWESRDTYDVQKSDGGVGGRKWCKLVGMNASVHAKAVDGPTHN